MEVSEVPEETEEDAVFSDETSSVDDTLNMNDKVDESTEDIAQETFQEDESE